MKDKLDYTPLPVILARILMEHIDAPDAAQNPGTIDGSVIASWLLTNKLLKRSELGRVGLDRLEITDTYEPLAMIIYASVFIKKPSAGDNVSRVLKNMYCFYRFLVGNNLMEEDTADRFIENLLDELKDKVNNIGSKTAFDGDFVLKVDE